MIHTVSVKKPALISDSNRAPQNAFWKEKSQKLVDYMREEQSLSEKLRQSRKTNALWPIL